MSLVRGRDLAVSYGPRDVFAGIDCEIPHRARIALIGPNGCGKTSLLRVLAGLDRPSAGRVEHARGLAVGFLPQVPAPAGSRTLGSELRSAFADLESERGELAAMEAEIADRSRSGVVDEELVERYDRRQARFAARGGYEIDQRIHRVLTGLGFAPSDTESPLAELSGGQQTRALLGRLILSGPDLLLLDEPTNHLDLTAIEWLESFLREWDGALLVVAHDRAFLDNVAEKVWELAGGRLAQFPGNYSHYAVLRAEREHLRAKAYEKQQEQIERTEEYIRRTIGGQLARQAQSRRKALERLERVEAPRDVSVTPGMRLDSGRRGGDKVIRLRDLEVGFDPRRPLVRCEEVELGWRQRAALIGPNGSGKTTLIRTLLGELPALRGEARLGAGIRVGYLSQSHDRVRPDRTVLEHVQDASAMEAPEARAYLGRYRFPGDDVFKDVAALSGGERARLALALLELDGANLLLLDEPTNHLDIASQEALQEALAEFEGSILLVTHDRFLVRALEGQVWAIEGGRLLAFEAGLDEYRAWREADRASRGFDDKAGRRERYEAQKRDLRRAEAEARRLADRRNRIEADVARLEARVAAVEEGMARASEASDVEQVLRLAGEHAAVRSELDRLLQDWIDLDAEADGAEAGSVAGS